MERILVVEDDLSIQDIICEFLKEEGYHVDKANNGQEGYLKVMDNEYDLIITDIMMDIMDGYQFVKLVRNKNKDVLIIMLTALGEEYDEIKGFDLGIDDYITKPFSFKVLLKRVQSVLKRGKSNNKDVVLVDNIVLDNNARTVFVDDVEIELTLKEFEILKILMNNLDTVITREALLNDVWDYSYYGDTRVIDTHIKNIRKKTNTSKIKTVTGVGYKMEK